MLPSALRSVLVVTLAGVLAIACSGDDASEPTAPEDTAAATDGSDTAEPDTADADAEDAGDADEEPEPDATDQTSDEPTAAATGGEATWLGDELVLDRVTCGSQPGVGYVVRATNDDVDLAVVYDPGPDPTNPTYDFAAPDRVELYRGVAGGSIGDGEGYQAEPDLDTAVVAGVTGSEAGAAGTVALVPDDSTTAPEVNPDGGELTFAITC